MEKITLKLLVLAAASISPQLITARAESRQVKPVEQLSVEKLRSNNKPDSLCIYDFDAKKIAGLPKP